MFVEVEPSKALRHYLGSRADKLMPPRDFIMLLTEWIPRNKTKGYKLSTPPFPCSVALWLESAQRLGRRGSIPGLVWIQRLKNRSQCLSTWHSASSVGLGQVPSPLSTTVVPCPGSVISTQIHSPQKWYLIRTHLYLCSHVFYSIFSVSSATLPNTLGTK